MVRSPRFLAVGAGVLALVALLYGAWLAVSSALGSWPSPMVRGFVGGVALSSAVWVLVVALQRFDGSHSWRLGADGEAATAELLDRLGPEWQVFHNVPFAVGRGADEVDVDHIAVGPYGVLVIESKWCSDSIDIASRRVPDRVTRAVDQVTRNAGRVRAVLGNQISAEHVVPVVVFWGSGVRNSGEPVARQGTTRVVRGADADSWLHRVSEGRLASEVRESASDRLRNAIERQDRSMGRRGRGGETSEWLQLWCRRLGMAGGLLGAGAAALLLGLTNIDAPLSGWMISAIGILFGLVIPLALTGLVMASAGLGLRLRSRSVARWWPWPGLAVAGWAIYAVKLMALRM